MKRAFGRVFLLFERHTRQFATRFQTAFGKPTLVHFEHEAHGFGGAMGVGGLGLHVGQVDDGAVVCHKGCGEGDEGVFHPKTLGGGLLKHKQHAFVRGHVGAKHQANAALLGGLSHLGVDLIHARLQFDAWQIGLRAVLSLRGCAHEQAEGETQSTENFCEEVGSHG